MMKKILCIGDGFGKGHIWPMWPQLLATLANDAQIDNLSEIGAGNEFICNRIIDACEKNSYDTVLVQWTISKRLDIISNEDNNIFKYVSKDISYNTKYSNIKMNNRIWWLSSDSKTEHVKKYHTEYISEEQHKLRSIYAMKLIELYLKEKKIKNFCFFSSYRLDIIDLPESNVLDWSSWCTDDEYNGMYEYGKIFFPNFQTNEVQPHPIVQLNYLKNKLLPKLDIQINKKKLQDMELHFSSFKKIDNSKNSK